MPDKTDKCETCPEHSGQVERTKSAFGRINMVIWLIGIQITINLGIGLAIYNSLQSVQTSLALSASRMAALEEKVRNVEQTQQRLCDRVEKLERP